MERLRKNQGGYFGETIAIDRVLGEIQSETQKTGWHSECFLSSDLFALCAYRKTDPAATKRVYLSTGIHGDEPAGPLAILELMRENRWPSGMDLWLCPCLNPTGYALNRRENVDGIDLNRDYRELRTAEIRAHVEWLCRQPTFDLTLVLHEDWEANGFYLYELNPDNGPSAAESIVEAVRLVCPIEPESAVDGWTATGGIIRPQVHPKDRPQWPESIYLIHHKTRLSYTMEAPSDYPLAIRVNALKTAVRAAMDWLARR